MNTLPLIFQAIDLDEDDRISIDEFKIFFESFGVCDDKLTRAIFKELDTNHDQLLSKDG